MESKEPASKKVVEDPSTGLFKRVQQCRLGGRAQRDSSPYDFICSGPGAFPNSTIFKNCITREGSSQAAGLQHKGWRKTQMYDTWAINRSPRVCGNCSRTASEFQSQVTHAVAANPPSGHGNSGGGSSSAARAAGTGSTAAAVRGVGCSSAAGISVSREGVGAGSASDPCPLAHDVLMSDSSREVDVQAAFLHASNNSLLVGLAVQNAALARKLQLKQPKRYVLLLLKFPPF